MDKNRTFWNNTTEEIAKRIIKEREKKMKSRLEMAEEIQMPYKTLSRIERGERQLNVEEAACISNYFNITCDELLRGVHPKYYEISSETGLSPKAVEYLKTNYRTNIYIIEMLNSILENKEMADNLFNAFYIYATTIITDVTVHRSPILKGLVRNDLALQKKAIWSTVENFIFTVCEKIRIDNTDKYSKILEDKVKSVIKNMVTNKHKMQKEIDVFDKIRNGEEENL